ncbi:MAG: MarC family protein [Candidatus Micrarchaeota archaeon]|nr:MarC family protein [Candidatus Micrarchaeota archaeon]
MDTIATVFVKIFFILNPISSIPLYLASTQNKSAKEANEIALEAVVLAFILALMFLLVGDALLNFLGIDLNAFRVAGGVILFLLGLENTMNITFREKTKSTQTRASVLIATPMLTGPGLISTIITLKQDFSIVEIVIALLVAMILAYIFLRSSFVIVKYLGNETLNIINKIIGLLIMSIGANMILNGATKIIKNLTSI